MRTALARSHIASTVPSSTSALHSVILRVSLALLALISFATVLPQMRARMRVPLPTILDTVYSYMSFGNDNAISVRRMRRNLPRSIYSHGSSITFIAAPPKNVSNASGASSIPKLWVISSAAGSPRRTSASSSW